MRRLMIGAVAAGVLAASFAHAADVPGPPYRAANPPPPIAYWDGFYVGANLGLVWGTNEFGQGGAFIPPGAGGGLTTPPFFALFPPFISTVLIGGVPVPVFVPGQFGVVPATTARSNSIIGGGQAGYNWQRNALVFGVEADILGSQLRNSATVAGVGALAGTPVAALGVTPASSTTYAAEVNWMASVRGRLGFVVWERVLIYGTGGVAFADVDFSATRTISTTPALACVAGCGVVTAGESKTLMGWTAGVGGEWAIRPAWKLAAEYRHTEFESHEFNSGTGLFPIAGFTQTPIIVSSKLKTDEVTLRLNYQFRSQP